MIAGFIIAFSAVLAVSQGSSIRGPRIWNGTEVAIEEMPWMVQWERNGRQMCGGSILSEDYILTVGQCTGNPVNQMRVRAGTAQLGSGGSLHHVKFVYTHPKYHSFYDWQYDVAVAQVDPPFVFDSTRQPIRIGTKAPEIGSVGSVAGWGTSKNNSFGEENLMKQIVTITGPKERCEPREDLMFCGTGAFCGGDWGAPFVQDGVVVGMGSLQHYCYDTASYVSVIADENREFITETARLNYK